jgi:hypothetical protein
MTGRSPDRYGLAVVVVVLDEVVVVEEVVVDVDVVVVDVDVVVVGRVVVVVEVDVEVVELDVVGTVSVGEESSPLPSASTTRAPAATTMAMTRMVSPIAGHGDFFGGTGSTGPPGGVPGPP